MTSFLGWFKKIKIFSNMIALPQVLVLFFFLSASNAKMLCADGWSTVYVNTLAGWNVRCCLNGVRSNGLCQSPSNADYAGSCAEMFHLTNAFACDCGNLCNGTVVKTGTQKIVCQGSNCVCPNTSGCRDTIAPGIASLSTPTETTSSPTNGASSPKSIGLLGLIFLFSAMFTFFVVLE